MDPNPLKHAAERYGFPVNLLKPVSGGHFTLVYEYSTGERAYILRLTPPDDEVDSQSMRAIFEWVFYLASGGAPVSRPILSGDHRLIETIDGQEGTYLAVLFEKAGGILAEELPLEEWDETLVQNLGRATGKMHALAKRFLPPGESLRRPDWDQSVNCYNPAEQLDPSQASVLEKREKIWAAVQELPRDTEGYGMIHADLHGANFFVDPQSKTITVFDFDDCCYGWYAMDIAMCLFDILVLYSGEQPQRFASWFLENYLLGYCQENRLDPFWIGCLPIFLKLLETGIYPEVYRFDEDSEPGSWVRKFMAGRRQRIEAEVPYIDIDFSGIYARALARISL
jgi:amicoumacin kinase